MVIASTTPYLSVVRWIVMPVPSDPGTRIASLYLAGEGASLPCSQHLPCTVPADHWRPRWVWRENTHTVTRVHKASLQILNKDKVLYIYCISVRALREFAMFLSGWCAGCT